MAELPNSFWLMLVVVLQHCAAVEDAPSDPDWGSAKFDCELDIDDDQWQIRCESDNLNPGSEFLSLRFKGLLDYRKPISFKRLLNSMTESKVYSCNVFLRVLVRMDPTNVAEHCRNVNEYASHLTRILNETCITKVRITHQPSLKLFRKILLKTNQLSDVRIYNSSLSNISSLPFVSNNSIQELILKRNAIITIANALFTKYSPLKVLDLSENYLTFVNQTSFDGLESITTLDLSFNMLESLHRNSLSKMPMLNTIYLQNNKLSEIDEQTFERNGALQIIDLSNNDIKELPSKIFHNLAEITNISCSNCNISVLSKDLFKGLPKLIHIRLDRNRIQIIPDSIFSDLKYLRDLDLGFNNIRNITNEMFQFHPYLLGVNLTQNTIRSLKSGTFEGAPNIAVLDLSNNKLERLNDGHVDMFRDMEHLDLTQNQIAIVQLGKVSDVLIRKLFLSRNIISILDIKWKRMRYLEEMYVDDNILTSLEVPPCIPSIKQTITFSFKNNNISRLNLSPLLLDEAKVKTDRKLMMSCFFNGQAKNFVDLTHNPLQCDCNLYPFYRYIKDKIPRKFQLSSFLNVGNLICDSPRDLKNQTITNLKDDVLACRFSEDCPQSCTCGIRGKDNVIFVNCSGNDLESIPQTFPKGTSALYFSNTNLTSMSSLNHIELDGFRELHLDDNSISSLDGWKFPSSLRYLSLRENKLKTLSPALMHFVRNQTVFILYMGNNDRNCTCEREVLKNFLIENKNFIGDIDDILCQVTNNATASYLPLVSVPDSELCKSEKLTPSQQTMVISLCLSFAFLITVLVFYYKQRQLILSFVYIHFDILFRLCFSDEEADGDKIFDAFVAYSSSDRDIVMDLLQELENNPPYFKLCIHERNWLPGRFICDNILSSVQNSKRTIILLSKSFISSPWFNLELRAAVSKLSRDKICRIIVILTEKNVSLTSVDPELRHVISKRTYLVWKERWFWEKLRYAMPRNKRVSTEGGSAMCSVERTGSQLSLIETA